MSFNRNRSCTRPPIQALRSTRRCMPTAARTSAPPAPPGTARGWPSAGPTGWKKKFRPLTTPSPVSATVEAARGWQATSVVVNKHTEYEYAAKGTWKTQKGSDAPASDANGAADGSGKLVGVVLKGFELGEPFE